MKVLLFGPYADAAGDSSVEVQLPDQPQSTAGRVMSCLAEQQPELRPMLTAARLTVNCKYAGENDLVTQRDELAVLGLVSGG